MMIGRLRALLRRAQYLFQTEGLIPLLRQAFVFLAGYIFRYEHYYLYEHTLKERNEADYIPKIQNFTFKIVFTNEEADKLVVAGIDFRPYIVNARRGLEKGAVAFCFSSMTILPTSVGWQ